MIQSTTTDSILIYQYVNYFLLIFIISQAVVKDLQKKNLKYYVIDCSKKACSCLCHICLRSKPLNTSKPWIALLALLFIITDEL